MFNVPVILKPSARTCKIKQLEYLASLFGDIRNQKFVLPEKVGQSAPKSLKTCYPTTHPIMPNFRDRSNQLEEKRYKNWGPQTLFCHGQKRDYTWVASRSVQEARLKIEWYKNYWKLQRHRKKLRKKWAGHMCSAANYFRFRMHDVMRDVTNHDATWLAATTKYQTYDNGAARGCKFVQVFAAAL